MGAMVDSEFEYIAFISYKHEDRDRKWSKWILEYIEQYAIPKALRKSIDQKKLGKCYRDEDESSVGDNLEGSINLALESSKFLIVVCSKNTPQSEWVNNEIRHFIRHRPKENVFFVLIDGKPEDSFPPIINQFHQPFAALGKPVNTEPFRRTKERVLVKLVSGILGVDFDQLWDRESRRKSSRIIIRMCSVVVLISIASLFYLRGQERLRQQSIATLEDRSDQLALLADELTAQGEYVTALNVVMEVFNHNPKVNPAVPLNELKSQIWSYKGPSKALKDVNFDFSLSAERNGVEHLAVIKNGDIHLYNVNTGSLDQILHSNGADWKSVEIDQGGTQLLAISSDNKAFVYNTGSDVPAQILASDGHLFNAAKFNNSGTQILAMSSDFRAYLYNVASGAILQVWGDNENVMQSLEFSSDDSMVVATTKDGKVVLYDTNSNVPIKRWTDFHNSSDPFFQPLEYATFNKDATKIVATSTHPQASSIYLYDVNSDELERVWYPEKSYQGNFGETYFTTKAEFSPDGRNILVGLSDNKIYLYDTDFDDPLRFWNNHTEPVSSAHFNHDGSQILTTSHDGKAFLYELKSNEYLQFWNDHAGPVVEGGFNSNSTRIVTSGYNDEIFIYPLNTDKPQKVWHDRASLGLKSAEFNSDGSEVLIAGSNGRSYLYDVTSGELIRSWSLYNDILNFAKFSPDGLHFVAVSDDGKVYLHRKQSDLPIRVWDHSGSLVNSAEFSPDGSYVLTSTDDGKIYVYDVLADNPRSIREIFNASVNYAKFNNDGTQIVAASSNGNTYIYGFDSDEPIRVWEYDVGEVIYAEFNSDGHMVVASTVNGQVYVHDINSDIPTISWKHHVGSVLSARFDSDDRLIVTASSDGEAHLYDIDSALPIQRWNDPGGGVITSQFNASGKMVLTAREGGEVYLYDTRLNAPVWVLKNHLREVTSAQFNLDGTQFVSVSKDHKANLHNIQYKDLSSIKADFVDLGAFLSTFCLSPEKRIELKLSSDPPCWCQHKSYPSLRTWSKDYISRHPRLGSWENNWKSKFDNGEATPNPFTHIREDNWTCHEDSQKPINAPWNDYPDLKCLTKADVLGPAKTAIEKLKADNVCVAAFDEAEISIERYIGLDP